MILRLGDDTPEVHPEAWVAPTATVVGAVRLGRGVGVWYGCTLRADGDPMEIGALTSIQDGSVLHTDPGVGLTVGAEVTVGHSAILHGCTVADRVLIGMGAVVMNGATIGTWSVVGAGALVLEGTDIPPGSLVVGSPARVVRETTRAERDQIVTATGNYAELLRRHRDETAAAGAGGEFQV